MLKNLIILPQRGNLILSSKFPSWIEALQDFPW